MFIKIVAVGILVSMGNVTRADEKYTLETAKKELPTVVAKSIREKLSNNAFVVKNGKEEMCTIWFVNRLETKAGFKPSLTVMYPFQSGQLIGVMKVSGKKQYTDFRGQEIAAAVFTLRYGMQPEDGDHIGTSDTSDFLLAIPAKFDKDPKPISKLETLNEQSAKSAESTHPAIFSLLPAEKKVKQSMTHDENFDFWIMNVNLQTVSKGKKQTLPFKVILVGQSEA